VRFFSGNQAITANGVLALPHGLGVTPKVIWCRLQNTTAELGFTQFDITDYPLMTCDGVTLQALLRHPMSRIEHPASANAQWFMIRKDRMRTPTSSPRVGACSITRRNDDWRGRLGGADIVVGVALGMGSSPGRRGASKPTSRKRS